jgi:hypothetical protein
MCITFAPSSASLTTVSRGRHGALLVDNQVVLDNKRACAADGAWRQIPDRNMTQVAFSCRTPCAAGNEKRCVPGFNLLTLKVLGSVSRP